MNKTERSATLVFPPEDSSAEAVSAVKASLQSAGFSAADQGWLVRLFLRPDCFGNPDDNSRFKDDFEEFEMGLETVLKALKELVPVAVDRQTHLALLFSKLLDFGPRVDTWFLPNIQLKESQEIPTWVGEFQRHANFSTASPNVHKLIEIRDTNNGVFYFDQLLPFIFPEGVPLNQIVDMGHLNPVQRQSWSSNDFQDPGELEFWLIWRFQANTERCKVVRLQTLLSDFSDVPEADLGHKILGLLHAIGYALSQALGPGPSLNEGWQLVARELMPFLALLSEKQPELQPGRSALLKAWWHLARFLYGRHMGGLEAALSEELRNRLVQSASRHIGILRSLLRDEPACFEREDSPGIPVHDFYEKAFYVLLVLAPPWQRLKPLLLAFSEMKKPAVTSDLRAWPEYGRDEPPPYPYAVVPHWIAISMYPQNLQDELARDPHLRDLREEFAKFCLTRLKTKGKAEHADDTEADFVEPRVPWRQCYVQAVKVLRVNPGGRAHRTLFWLSQTDPDDTVRELAKQGYKQLRQLDRRKPNVDKGASPRRPLFEAFWWLRQAHLLTLERDIDAAGARRTRRKERQRTREKDEHLN